MLLIKQLQSCISEILSGYYWPPACEGTSDYWYLVTIRRILTGILHTGLMYCEFGAFLKFASDVETSACSAGVQRPQPSFCRGDGGAAVLCTWTFLLQNNSHSHMMTGC